MRLALQFAELALSLICINYVVEWSATYIGDVVWRALTGQQKKIQQRLQELEALERQRWADQYNNALEQLHDDR